MITTRNARIALLALALSALAPSGSHAQDPDWPQWLGPQRNGISTETGLFGARPPLEEVWRVEGGAGFSALSVTDGKLYTMYARGESEYAVCLDAASGAELWATRTGGRFADSMGGPGPRSTPTVAGGTVYAASAESTIYALDAATGAVVWSVDLTAELGSKRTNRHDWGYAASPLVEDGRVLVEAGGRDNRALAAFSADAGKLLWSAGNDEPGYSSPIAATIGGRRQAVFFTGYNLLAVTPDRGTVLWQHRWRTDYDANTATPVFIPPNRLFISSDYGTGGSVVEITGTSGSFAAREVWRNRKMKNHMATSIYYEDHLYGFDSSILKCLDAKTGEDRWKTRGYHKGTLIIADGHLVVLGERGNLAIAAATPAGFTAKAEAQVFKSRCWTAPSIAAGRIYVRDESEIVCLNITPGAGLR